jgi:hypothetical protein
MKPDSEIIRRLTAAKQTHAMVVADAGHELDKQTVEQRQEYNYQLHVLDAEIGLLEHYLGNLTDQPERQRRGHAGPSSEKAARFMLEHKLGVYSSVLNVAERDQENHTQQEEYDYRYRLHGLSTEITTLQWLLDLNAHNQPTGEHLVREANAILNTPPAA